MESIILCTASAQLDAFGAGFACFGAVSPACGAASAVFSVAVTTCVAASAVFTDVSAARGAVAAVFMETSSVLGIISETFEAAAAVSINVSVYGVFSASFSVFSSFFCSSAVRNVNHNVLSFSSAVPLQEGGFPASALSFVSYVIIVLHGQNVVFLRTAKRTIKHFYSGQYEERSQDMTVAMSIVRRNRNTASVNFTRKYGVVYYACGNECILSFAFSHLL